MAERPDDLSDAMRALTVDDARLKTLGLDDNDRMELNKIENECESVFSWDIARLTGISQNLMVNIVDKAREKCELILDNDNAFSLNRFYLKLVIIYELFSIGNYEESLLEIENVIKYMETCTFNESNEQYFDAYNHIIQSTNAYIVITLKRHPENIMKNIKPVKSLSRAEEAAICAVKARVFMEYPPKGNDVALKLADQARKLYSTEPEWIIIWLKAKGRVRRFYHQFIMPDKYEMNAAEILSTTITKSRLLIQASKLYMEIAFINKLNNNTNESKKYYKLSSDLTLRAIELANDDIKQLYSCLMTSIDYPKEFQSKTEIHKIITKLANVNNSRVDQVLGKYYLKHEKNYEKAKIHLTRAMVGGHFNSSLQLIKVECLLQPVNKYPIVQSLNYIYEVFTSPKRRLIILSQILLYYSLFDYNPKEIMFYLKLYMDQNIDNTFKKRHLIFTFPLFKLNQPFIPKQFLLILSKKVKNIVNSNDWNTADKEMYDETLKQFNDMMNVKMNENRVNVKPTSFEKPRFNGGSNKQYYNRTNNESNSWRKKQVNSTNSFMIDQNLFSSKKAASNNTYELNYAGPNKNIKTDKIDVDKSSKPICNNKSFKLDEPIDNSKTFIEMKLNKFKNQYSSTLNVCAPLENDSTHSQNTNKSVISSNNRKSNWRNQSRDHS